MSNIIIQSRGILSVLVLSGLLSACGGGGGGGNPTPVNKASSVANSLVPNPTPSSSSRATASSTSAAVSSLATSSSAGLSSSNSSLSVSSALSSTISSSAISASSLSAASTRFSSMSSSLSSLAFSSSSLTTSSSVISSSAIALVPAQPKNLTSQRQIGVGVSLNWVDEANNETAYVVKRAAIETPDTWVTLSDSLPANTVSYTDTSVNTAEAKAYVYQIRAAIGPSLSQPLNSSEINLLGYQHPKSGSLSPVAPTTWSSANWKLGGRFNSSDLEIAVYSKHAERILLEIYPNKHLTDAQNNVKAAQARQDYWLVKGPDNIWRGKLANVPENTLYAFRTWGPNWKWDEGWYRGNSKAGFISDVSREGPAEAAGSYTGHRFNPNKLLADPYGLEYSHDTGNPELLAASENDEIFGIGGADLVPLVAGSSAAKFQYKGPITGNLAMDRRNIDTGIWAPKSVALRISPYTASKPNVAQQDGIQMETHLRGLTKHPSTGQLRSLLTNYQQWFDNFDDVKDIPEELRGTYKGAGMMAPYLKALGINVIEFLPVQETRNDPNDKTPTEANFWGYMTNGFFAPDRFYSSDKSLGGPTREFREMVEAFNQYGIEVWMDVVYNHTGEGGNWGNPFVTGFNVFGGFDTVEYYHLNPFDKRYLEAGATGTGNQLNFSRDVNHNLVLDSLNYWADNMGISGFRFDLATVLGREPDLHQNKPASEYWSAVKNFNSNHRTLIAIRELGASKNVKVTAEAWDNWGYAVGKFPNGWAEWNGRFRDSTRRFLKGDPSGDNGISLNDAFHGDYANFNDNGGPQKSVNFIVAHDGLTLADLVSYNSDTTRNGKLPAPFGPSNGGTDNNESWDSTGIAKPVDLSTEQFRRQRLRNFWVFQFFSRGTPMIVYGDEFARTQNGNNNPYSIDSPATWNNYAMLASNAPQSVAVHPSYPSAKYDNNLGTASNSNATVNPLLMFSRELMQRRKGDPALRQGNYAMPIQYASETGGFMAGDARARRMHLEGSKAGGSDYVLFMNMKTEKTNFSFPTPPAGKTWKLIIDTGHWAEKDNFNFWKDSTAKPAEATYGVNAWSIVVFKAL